jgi:ABC-2 type transport system ATP-binding protein
VPGVRAVASFGAALHLRTDPDRLGAAEVDAALRAAGAREVRVEPSEPSLEDVFLAVVERGGRAGEGP